MSKLLQILRIASLILADDRIITPEVAKEMFLQYKKVWKWSSYIFGEYVYITLSFVAKALLAWQVWSGTLR